MVETLLKNDLTRYGLRRIHVLATERIDRERWLGLAPFGAERSLCVCEYQDKAVGFWHAWLVWHVWGEVVKIEDRGQRTEDRGQRSEVGEKGDCSRMGVLWYVENGERMGQVIEDAALRYLITFDRWPTTAWTADVPKGAPEGIEIEDETGQRRIEIQQATWVPKRCVFVTE